jgi:hypothetical protein
MLDGEKYSYEIVRINHQTHVCLTADLVRGLSSAERAVDSFNRKLSADEKAAGWSHFQQRTTKKPGSQPRPLPVSEMKPGSHK